MEPDDNFSLVNSYSIDEAHPRQLPKAVTFNKVDPNPSVPDVSLVFDSKVNDMRNFSNKHVDNSHPLHEDGPKSPKNEDNGPRKTKPMPIAPLPNETYAAWRARALIAQNCMGSLHPEATLKSGPISPCDRDINESFVAVRKVRETSNTVPNGLVSSRHFQLPSEKSNWCSSEKTRDGDVRVTTLPHQNETISETFGSHKRYNQSRSMTSRPGYSLGTTNYGNNSLASPNVARKNQPSIGISGEDQFLPDHPGFVGNKIEKGKAPIVGDMKQTESSHQVVQDHSTKEVVDDFRPHCWDESSVPSNGSVKKRDALRDLYRIVQLQNEQLQLLQSQVEKLLKKNLAASSISTESTKSRGRGTVVMCVEEGTQTLPEPSGVSSVGVMTSFIDSNKRFDDARGDFVHDDAFCCQCKGCPISSSSSDSATDSGMNLSHASGNPVGQKFEAPRPLRNLRKVHQVIEEETESDENTIRLTNEVASQTRMNSHLVRKPDVHPERDVRGYMMNLNNPSRDCPNEGRSKSRTSSSNGNKLVRKGSNPDTVSHGGKKIPDKCGQNCKQVENLKHCPRQNSVNHKTLAPRSRQNDDEMTMTLNGVDLQTVTDPQLSPEPSIHVEIQDYKDFSGEVEGPSDEDSYYSGDEDSCSESGEGEDHESLEQKQTHNNPSVNKAEYQEGHDGNVRVGWTFYNNVLGQVNKLLENQESTNLYRDVREERSREENLLTKRPEASPIVHPGPASSLPSTGPIFQHPDSNNHKVLPSPTLEVVREATLQHLRELGIDISNEQLKNKFSSPVPSNNMPHSGVRDVQDARRVTFDPQNIRGRHGGERRPTETSLRIKALALKYLSDEQLASCGYLDPKDSSKPESLQVPEKPSNLTPGVIGEMSSSADFTLYGMNGTNLSFTTLRYLQRYHLLPSNGAGPAGIWRHQEGIQQTNFMESAALARGLDIGNTRSLGHIDYTNDYMDGFHQGANSAPVRNGQGGKVHSSTPANKMDHPLPSPNMIDTGKEACFLPRRGDFIDGARDVNSAGKRIGQSDNKVTTKSRGKGKHGGPHVPRDKGFKTNGNQSPCMPGKNESERPPHCNILREGDQKQRVHNESLKSSNILDITALRQQPKLL